MEATENVSSKAETGKNRANIIPMAIVAGLFFILGFATWINGSLMPYLKQILQLTPFEASLILFSFYIAVTFAAIPSSLVIQKVGYKNGMALGMSIMMTAGLLFIPAAETQQFALFLFAQLLMGTGITLLQTAVNPYVVRIGPEESAAVRISIMGILNKSAGVIAPIVFSALILNSFKDLGPELSSEQIDQMADGLVMPYLGMAIFIGVLALLVKLSPLPELESEDESGEGIFSHLAEVLSHPNLVLGAIAIFFYVAVEVIAGDTIGSYALSLGIENYAVMTSYTMVCMVTGYILGIIFIPKYLSQQKALTISAILGLLLSISVISINNHSYFIYEMILQPFGGEKLPDSLLMIALLGLANAIVWPAVFPLALSGLGKLTSAGSALLIMGIAGGAVGPVAWSLVSTISDNAEQGGYIVMIPSYAFILFYAIKGHKMRSWKN